MRVVVNQWVYQTAVELARIFGVECVTTNMYDGMLISVHEQNWEWNRNEEIEMKRMPRRTFERDKSSCENSELKVAERGRREV